MWLGNRTGSRRCLQGEAVACSSSVGRQRPNRCWLEGVSGGMLGKCNRPQKNVKILGILAALGQAFCESGRGLMWPDLQVLLPGVLLLQLERPDFWERNTFSLCTKGASTA